MLLFTSLFGGLMLLSTEKRRRMIAILLIGCIAILGISPPPAQAQFGCLPCAIQTVLTTINQTIGKWLTRINNIVMDIQKFYEQTVWPIAAINQAKGQIQAIIMRFRAAIQSIMVINPHTATLPNPIALESIIRNRITADISSVPRIYVNTFRPVRQATSIAPQDRDMTDMDDALAQDNLMTLKEADQAQDLELALADQIENMVADPDINVSAPGSSSLITAAAVAGEIKSQAVMQKMLAPCCAKKPGAWRMTTRFASGMPRSPVNCKPI